MDADDLIRRLADVAGGALQEWGRSSATEEVDDRNVTYRRSSLPQEDIDRFAAWRKKFAKSDEEKADEGEHIVNEKLQHKLAEVYNKVKQIQGSFTHSDPARLRCQEVLDYIKGDNNADS